MSRKPGALTSGGPLQLAVFDMDGVLVDHVSSWAVVHEALGTDNSSAVLDFMEGRIDDHEFIRRDVELWRGRRPDLSAADLHDILSRTPRMPGLREAIGDLRRQGTKCAIVSGGLRPLAELIAREGGFDAVRANNVRFGADGRLLDEGEVEVPLRAKGDVVRALQMELGIGPEETGAVGDSQFDRGLFSRARVSVAFNPKDDAVSKAATHNVVEKDLRAAVKWLLDGPRVARFSSRAPQ